MPQVYISGDDPRKEQLTDLGGGMSLFLYLDNLRPVEENEVRPRSLSLAMLERNHLDLAVQQNRYARIICMATVVGFVMIIINAIAMAETTSLATRAILGGASALALSLGYFFRSTIMTANREVLAQRREIPTVASQIEEREKEQNIAILMSLLKGDSDALRAIWKPTRR